MHGIHHGQFLPILSLLTTLPTGSANKNPNCNRGVQDPKVPQGTVVEESDSNPQRIPEWCELRVNWAGVQ